LKVLSRITEPTSGEVKIYGKVASLLEVGTGFHPELSGRENIFLNGAILGMPRSEIRRKFDQIVDFSGVEKFLDTPVKHYSSGMYVRLAFSVSAWLDPDILIVDEVLSVGDQAFQKKCAGRMKELTGDGRTVIFVSHSMAAVKSMCEKALFLKDGKAVSYGPVEEGTTEYTRSVMEGNGQRQWHKARFVFGDEETESYTDSLSAVGYAECIEGELELENGTNAASIAINESFKIHLKYRLLKDVPGRVVPNFHFFDESGGRFFVSYPEQSFLSSQGVYHVVCEIPAFLFNVGRFTVMPALSTYELTKPVHFALPEALRFEIKEPEGADARRHGWTGSLPGLTRPRLNWYGNRSEDF
ncbi:MAG: ABC transporter ATP-binding protein, partial [Chlorobium sp.]|nr:ABC transporter ATP-binding protein [Chlorobium sp.]